MLFLLLTIAAVVAAVESEYLYTSEIIKGTFMYDGALQYDETYYFYMHVNQSSAKLRYHEDYDCQPIDVSNTTIVKLDVELFSNEPPALIFMDKQYENATIYRVGHGALEEALIRVTITCAAIERSTTTKFLRRARRDVESQMEYLGV